MCKLICRLVGTHVRCFPCFSTLLIILKGKYSPLPTTWPANNCLRIILLMRTTAQICFAAISFPESSLPLSSGGAANKDLEVYYTVKPKQNSWYIYAVASISTCWVLSFFVDLQVPISEDSFPALALKFFFTGKLTGFILSMFASLYLLGGFFSCEISGRTSCSTIFRSRARCRQMSSSCLCSLHGWEKSFLQTLHLYCFFPCKCDRTI